MGLNVKIGISDVVKYDQMRLFVLIRLEPIWTKCTKFLLFYGPTQVSFALTKCWDLWKSCPLPTDDGWLTPCLQWGQKENMASRVSIWAVRKQRTLLPPSRIPHPSTLSTRLYLRFWYQVLTCVSVRLREAASSIRSWTLKYFWRSKLRSNCANWWSVKAVRAFLGFLSRTWGLSLLLEISLSPSSFTGEQERSTGLEQSPP